MARRKTRMKLAHRVEARQKAAKERQAAYAALTLEEKLARAQPGSAQASRLKAMLKAKETKT